MSLNASDVALGVADFMAVHPLGWIKHEDLRRFLDSKSSLKEVCTAVPGITDLDLIDKALSFLECAVTFEDIASELVSAEYSVFLRAAAGSPSERLRSIVVKAFDVVKRPSFPMEADLDLLLTLLSDEDTGVSEQVTKLLKKWVSTTIEPEKERLDYVSRLVGLYSALKPGLNETCEFRYISLFIDISKASPSLFSLIQKRGVFDDIIGNFLSSNSDILVKLGSLTFIENLSSFESGQRYLAESNVLRSLESELSGPYADSTTKISLLYSIASIVAFTHAQDQLREILLSSSSRLSGIISQFMTSVNNAERMCSMKVLSRIAASADTNESVGAFMRHHWRALSQIPYALSDTDVEVVNCALDSLHTIIKQWERNPFMESVTAQNTLIEAIKTTFKRHPFSECRSLVYSLLGAILSSEELADPALEQLLSDPSPIRSALLDHHSESDYSSRLAKCDFVRVLVKNEEKRLLKRYFKKDEIENFIDFAEQGLQWVPVTTGKDELATEAG